MSACFCPFPTSWLLNVCIWPARWYLLKKFSSVKSNQCSDALSKNWNPLMVRKKILWLKERPVTLKGLAWPLKQLWKKHEAVHLLTRKVARWKKNLSHPLWNFSNTSFSFSFRSTYWFVIEVKNCQGKKIVDPNFVATSDCRIDKTCSEVILLFLKSSQGKQKLGEESKQNIW